MATAAAARAARALKPVFEDVKLNTVIANLKAEPKLVLRNVKQLKVSFASANDHFGARYFAREYLPRISYVNPTLDIQMRKSKKKPDEKWRPELEVVFEDDTTTTINMNEKWSTAITKELMDAAGGEAWKRYVKASIARGNPVLPGEENEATIIQTEPDNLPSLATYMETPEAMARRARTREVFEVKRKASKLANKQKGKKAPPADGTPVPEAA